MKPGNSTSIPFEEYHPAEGLFEQDKDIEGKEIFQVNKSKLTPKANRRSLFQKFETSLSISTDANKSTKSAKSEVKQSRTSRLKMKQELARLKSTADDSDPEDSDNASDNAQESESQSDDEVYSSAVCDISKGRKNKAVTFSEAYFAAQKKTKTVTSNKTLSNVKLKQTSVQELAEIMQNIPENHKEEREALFKKYCSQFNRWESLLQADFNILLYGVGSKERVLKAFCEQMLRNELHVVIYGFFPSLSLKQILCTITEDALEHDGKFTSIQDHCNYIKEYFSESNEKLFVVIHSIDGLALRSVKTQSVLSVLATIPSIHFICSMDHINSPLLWDQIMLSHFKWVWFDTTTFDPYILETSYENSLLRDQSSHLLLSSLFHVYNSLTPNSRGVFLILAKHQKQELKSINSGITFNEWYQECREAFLVNSEITMQAQLSEFKNHKLLSSRKNSDGIELWYIPVDSVTLDQFLEGCE